MSLVEALRAGGTQEDRFHLAMLHSPVGMAVVAIDGGFLEVNEALCRMLGRTQEHLLASRWQDLTHPEDVAVDAALVQRLLDGELDSYKLRKRYLTPDGDVVHGQLTVVAVRDDRGQVEFFISQLSDLTALVEMTNSYRLIAENVNDVVAVGNTEGVLQWVSESVFPTCGWRPDDLEGVAFRELVHPDDVPIVKDAQASLEAGQARQVEVRLRKADGDYRWMNLRVRPLYDDSGTLIGRVVGHR